MRSSAEHPNTRCRRACGASASVRKLCNGRAKPRSAEDRDGSNVRRPLWTLAVQSVRVGFETDMADSASAAPEAGIDRRWAGSRLDGVVVRVLLRGARWAKSVCWMER